jgi:hypothetical protein
MHTKLILTQIDNLLNDTTIGSTHNTKLKKLKKDIYQLHIIFSEIISKNINEIDIIQDEIYDLKKEIKIVKELNYRLNNMLEIKENIIFIKNKRILKIMSRCNKSTRSKKIE